MAEPLWVTLGVVITAVFGYLGVRVSARQSARAAEKEAAAKAAAVKAEERQVNVAEWESILNQLRTEVARLAARVEVLERDRAQWQTKYLSAIRYARDLLKWARHHTTDTPPAAPDAIAQEF